MRLMLAGQGQGSGPERRDQPLHALFAGRVEQEAGKAHIVFNNQQDAIARLNVIAIIVRFVDEIETGMTHINSPTTGGEAHIPFGGIKGTGIGDREQGSTALDFYTELKVVYVDYTGRKREGNLY